MVKLADLNGDGEDDILIHDFNQLQLFIADNGEFKQQTEFSGCGGLCLTGSDFQGDTE